MKKSIRSILTLALPYGITVILPIIAIVCLGGIITKNYQETMIQSKEQNIETAFRWFCQRMQGIEELSYIIAEDTTILQYVYGSLQKEPHSVTKNMEIIETLNSFLISSDVETMYLYDPINSSIITPQEFYSEIDDYFKYVYKIAEPLEESLERLQQLSWGYGYRHVDSVRLHQNNTEVIEYNLAIPLERIRNAHPQLIMVMEVEDILKEFQDILEEEDGLFLYDYRGNLIYHWGGQEGFGENAAWEKEENTGLIPLKTFQKGSYGMRCSSPDGKWKVEVYIAELPLGELNAPVIRRAWGLIGMALCASILFCCYFTFRNHREIQNILRLFSNHKTLWEDTDRHRNSNGYEMIREYANRIITENREIAKNLPELKKAQKYEVLDKLIRNTWQDTAEDPDRVLEPPFAFTGKCVVLCIRYTGSSYRACFSEEFTVKDYVKSYLMQIITQNHEIFDTSARETICVLSVQEEEFDLVAEEIISKLNSDIIYEYHLEMEVGVGNVVDSIYQIFESYQQARAVLQYQESSGKNIHVYKEISRLEEVYYYPKEFDEKIFNYVMAGKKEEAKEIIGRIYHMNFEENHSVLAANAAESIKSRLRDTLHLLVRKCRMEEEQGLIGEFENLMGDHSTITFFWTVYKIIDMVSDRILITRNVVRQNSALKIMQYINDNYCDSMLSMKQISRALGLHESYISNLFRSEYGKSVSAVIESKRIDKACQLIRSTDMKIGDVALSVGYASDVSFRRAFTRSVKVSPSEYRSRGESK